LHAHAIRLFFGTEGFEVSSVAERAEILQTHETYVSTITKQALERLSTVAAAFDAGAFDDKELWAKHKIRNVFSVFYRMGVTWDRDKEVDALHQEARTLVGHVTDSLLEHEVICSLYGLHGKNSQISTGKIAGQLRRSQSGIRVIERRVLKAMAAYKEASKPSTEA